VKFQIQFQNVAIINATNSLLSKFFVNLFWWNYI